MKMLFQYPVASMGWSCSHIFSTPFSIFRDSGCGKLSAINGILVLCRLRNISLLLLGSRCLPELEEARFWAETAVSVQRQAVHHGRRGGGNWYPGLETSPKLGRKQETLIVGKGEMLASFEAGRHAKRMARVAVRAWRKIDDADRAEALYLKALELAPEDSAIQTSYAEFS